MKTFGLLTILIVCLVSKADAQSQASIDRMNTRYTAEQLQDMRDHDTGKYNSMVWWYAHSWEIVNGGNVLAPTEADIKSIDITQYDSQRTHDKDVTLTDYSTGKTLVLKCGLRCWAELKTVLSAEDWTAMHDRYMYNYNLKLNQELPKASN